MKVAMLVQRQMQRPRHVANGLSRQHQPMPQKIAIPKMAIVPNLFMASLYAACSLAFSAPSLASLNPHATTETQDSMMEHIMKIESNDIPNMVVSIMEKEKEDGEQLTKGLVSVMDQIEGVVTQIEEGRIEATPELLDCIESQLSMIKDIM